MCDEIIKSQSKKNQEKEKVTKELQNSQKTINKMSLINLLLSILTLNVNKLNSPIKRYRVTQWIRKTRPNYMLPTRDPLQT